MKLGNCDGLSETDIRALSHEELIEVVLHMLDVDVVKAEDYIGSVVLVDSVVDALRNRI